MNYNHMFHVLGEAGLLEKVTISDPSTLGTAESSQIHIE